MILVNSSDFIIQLLWHRVFRRILKIDPGTVNCVKLTLKYLVEFDLWQTPLQAIDFKGEKEGVQLESSPVYEGIKTYTLAPSAKVQYVRK